jgi:hypothetical protein
MRMLICLSLLAVLGATSADAQWKRHRDRHHRGRDRAGPVQFGVRGGYDFEQEVGSAGAQLRIPLIRQVLLEPSADVFFDDAATEWQLNADVIAAPDELGGLYLGAGAAFASRDDDFDADDGVEAGFNLLLGIDSGRVFDTRLRPFAEARWTGVGEFDAFRLVLGANVPI